MDRLKREDKGFTLLEVLIAAVLFTVVVLAASNLLISFGNFSTRVVRSEASLMGTALGAFEEIVGRIAVANEVTVSGIDGSTRQIAIRVDKISSNTPSDFTDDTVYTYWQDGTQLKYKSKVGVGAESAESVIAEDIASLGITKIQEGKVRVVLNAQTTSGTTAGGAKERLETTVTLRASRAD